MLLASPEADTAAGSADIMSHIFEGYFCRADDSELSDGIAETSLSVSTGRTFDSCRVFLLSDDTGALPLCSALQPELS